MASTPTSRTSRHLIETSFFATALVLLASCGAVDSGPASADSVHPDADICDPAGVGAETDVFALDESGRFSAVAVVGSAVEGDRRGTVPVNVLSQDGRLIASTGPFEISTPAIVDLATGIQFGVAPPPVFEVAGKAQIRVAHGGRPYELVLVRTAPGAETRDGQLVRPPLGSPVSTPIDICSSHSPRSIQLDAIYAEPVGRQVFVISPSKRATPGASSDVANSTGLRADGFRTPSSSKPTPSDTTDTGTTS